MKHLIWIVCCLLTAAPSDLEQGFRHPPSDAKPDVYWLWLNGFVHPESARADLVAMKDAGFGGVLLFDMGAAGDKTWQPPAGPAFLSPPWMARFQESVAQARSLGLAVDFSVISSWDMGGHWIEPRYASKGLYTTEATVEGGKAVDTMLPFPLAPPAAPKGADGKPAFWTDVAVLAIREPRRLPGHEFIIRFDPDAVVPLKEVVLDNGTPNAPADLAATMTPTREFSVAFSTSGTQEADFHEAVRGTLPAAAGPSRFAVPAGTKGRYVRLRLLSGHDTTRPRWTLGEFTVLDAKGESVAASRQADNRRNGAYMVSSPTPLGYDGVWNLDNLHDGSTQGPGGVFASAGLPTFQIDSAAAVVDLTAKVDREGRLRWTAPAGRWTILRYVCMNTGERLKVPSPNSDGWATDHLDPEATRVHMDYVIARLREKFGDLRASGIKNLYLASYEVRGMVWSPTFTKEFQRRRGYDMTPYLPAIFGARIGSENHTARFLFDYRKTLGEVMVDSYYAAAREIAHQAGLGIKSEAGGPGPPTHNVPVDALSADNAVDEVQGEFWPFWPNSDALWVVKETASAAHLYGKPRVHEESFTSFEEWREGPQDLKASADRVFCEGGNHIVWHTWTHNAPEAGVPGWAYGAGTHINRNVTWWPKAKPFLDYLARSSYLLQRGTFVADVLYYYGDGGYKFVPPKHVDPSLGLGYDYDVTNSDVILHRLTVRDGRLTVPGGPSYAVLVLPDSLEMHPDVLAKIEQLVAAGATVAGPKPAHAVGLENQPKADAQISALAAKLWGSLDGKTNRQRTYGKGHVIWGVPLRDVLAARDLPPDLIAPASVDFIHRRQDQTDIYFVRNKTSEPIDVNVRFRAAQREPELWDPISSAIQTAGAYRVDAQGVEVPLSFAKNGSMFVVFRRPAPAGVVPAAARPTVVSRVLPIEGAWEVEFEKDRKAPPRMTLAKLESWTDVPDPGVRNFSGTARYRKTFTLPAGWRTPGQRVFLDLGDLWTIGEAWLNGKPLGIVWTAPFRAECTAALVDGPNELVVEVTNTWLNRIAGDARLPAAERITHTNVQASGFIPWVKVEPLRSGLFGPVRLETVPRNTSQ